MGVGVVVGASSSAMAELDAGAELVTSAEVTNRTQQGPLHSVTKSQCGVNSPNRCTIAALPPYFKVHYNIITSTNGTKEYAVADPGGLGGLTPRGFFLGGGLVVLGL